MKPTVTSLGGWIGGTNSLLHPTLIPKVQFHWSENTICRGGVVQTRPGLELKLNLAGTKLQGLTSFSRFNGIPYLVFVIDGLVYVSQFPFDVVTQLTELSFDPDVEQVFFEVAVQSAKRDSVDNHLEVITPKRVLIIQDGVTRPATWDGTVARHVSPEAPEYGPPVGTVMKWTSSRLWVLSGSQVVVSDYADPTSFSENIYIAERSNFQLPDEGTGMLVTPDQKNLLVFTRNCTTSFQSSIRNRTLWQLTPNFQQELIPDIGCMAARSCINQFGTSWWYAEGGLIDLNSALFSQRDSKLKYRDNEMMRSKRNISHNTHSICSAYFDNLLLVSVPSGGMLNFHTYVLDGAVVDIPGENQNAWASIWTGITPVEWTSLNISGDRKLYAGCISETQHEGKVIQIWEAMTNVKTDAGFPIRCQFETRSTYIDGQFHKFQFAEFDLVEIYGDVRLQAWFAATKGGYEEILDCRLQAEKGSVGSIGNERITNDTIFQSYRPQTRIIRSEGVVSQDGSDNSEGCVDFEDQKRNYVSDKAFSILMEWSGQLGVRGINLNTHPDTAKNERGDCIDDETGHNILTERGESSEVA